MPSDYETDRVVGMRRYLERETNVNRILITHPDHPDGSFSYEKVDFWKVAVQEFLCIPNLRSLVLLGFPGSRAVAAFRENVAALIQPHIVRVWRQRTGYCWGTGLEIFKQN
jgi:hypothetical protein